jgi:hypothetical protein
MQPETESLAERMVKLEHALVVCAWVVDTYGPHYAPLFKALEHQLNRAHNTASVVERAKRVLDQHPEYPPWHTEWTHARRAVPTSMPPPAGFPAQRRAASTARLHCRGGRKVRGLVD